MRISSQTVNNMATGAMGGAYDRYANLIKKITENKNFTTVAENVPDAVSLLKIKNQLSEIDGYQGNIQHAINELNLTYDTLGSVNDELTAINNLVMAASNATTTEDAAKAYASEISERMETVKDLMNTKYLDNYIFSGTFVEEPAYKYGEDGTIVYNGSPKEAGDRNIMISPDTPFAYNFTGEEIFGKQDGVSDFFSQMTELVKLLNGEKTDSGDGDGSGESDETNTGLDYDGIRNKLIILEKTIKNVTQANGTVSAKVSKLQATQEINDDTLGNLTEKRVNIEEVDIIKAASDLAAARTGLQASYAVGTSVLSNVSLLDYI